MGGFQLLRPARAVSSIAVALVALLAIAECRGQFQPDSIFFNLVEKPTRNTNVFGTTFDGDGFVQTWGNNYLLYELQMSIPNLQTSPYYFDFMYVQVVANKGNQNTNPNNPLRVALFNENPVADPENQISDAFALTRATINQAAVSPTFTQYLVGPSSEGGIPVNDSASNYWLVLYASGAVANQGYGLKVDSLLKEVEFYDNTAEVVDVKYYGGDPPEFRTSETFVPVPEPSSLAMAAAGIGIACVAARRRMHA